jgi:hypothetical protein
VRVYTKALYRSAVTWSPGKKLSTASSHSYLGEGLYKGLVSLRGDVVPGENVEPNLTQPYLGEGLYEGLVSLRGDLVPGEEVENKLTLLPYLCDGFYKGLVLPVGVIPGEEVKYRLTPDLPWRGFVRNLVSLRGDMVTREKVENNLLFSNTW